MSGKVESACPGGERRGRLEEGRAWHRRGPSGVR
jgi:hypothetical protein